MPPLFAPPASLAPPAANAELLYNQDRFEEAVAFCQKELALCAREIPAKSVKRPAEDAPRSPAFQFYALTLILVDALAELERWKAAKEALGKYRAHFPRDPWGFTAGAVIQRRDTAVHDPAAVQRAIELLENEAKRLETRAKK
jgi:tetratricopeptide (TPR) repeat protein